MVLSRALPTERPLVAETLKDKEAESELGVGDESLRYTQIGGTFDENGSKEERELERRDWVKTRRVFLHGREGDK